MASTNRNTTEKMAFEEMMNQMSDSCDDDSDSDDECGQAKPISMTAPTKLSKLSSSASSKSIKLNEDEGFILQASTNRSDVISFTPPRASRNISERKELGSRHSIVDRILKDNQLDAQSKANSFRLHSSSHIGFKDDGGFKDDFGESSAIAEIEKFGYPVDFDSQRAQPLSDLTSIDDSHLSRMKSRGSLIGGIPSVDDKFVTTRKWLTRPCPKGEPPLLCYVERVRNLLTMQTTFRCYMEPTEDQSARFLMAAKKKPGKQASYYLVSMEFNPEDRGSEALLGKIRANTIGSQYIVTDHGLAPDRTQAPSTLRKELGLVRFQFDSGGPSRMEVWIPLVQGSGNASTWQPVKESDGIETAVDNKVFEKLSILQSKHPKWDASHGGHVLNFQGRVSECSVKNFQLHMRHPEYSEEVNLQFGRVGKHKFVMDVKYPLSPLQAFGICVACMDGKIADRKGYEYIRKLTGTL